MNRRAFGFLPALGALLLTALPALAVDKTWTGASSTTWSTAGNWSPAGAPGAGDRAILTPAANAPSLTASTTLNQLVVQAGATLTIATGVTLSLNTPLSPIIDGTGTVVTLGTGRILLVDGTSGSTLFNDSITLGNFTLDPVGATKSFYSSPGITVTFNGSLTLVDGRLRFGVATTGAPVTVDINGNLAINGGLLELRSPGSVLRVSGNWTQTGSFLAGVNSTVVFDGTTDQTVNIDRRRVTQFDFEHVTIANGAGIVTYQNNDLTATPNGFNVLGNLTLLAGARLVVLDYAVIGNAATDVFGIGSGATATFVSQMDCDGTLSFDVDAGADNGLLVLQGGIYPPSDGSGLGTSLIPGNGTVRAEFSTSGTLPCAGRTFNILDVAMPGAGPGILGLRQLSADGAFTVQTLRLTAGSFVIPSVTVTAGSVDSSPAGTSLLDFSGTGVLQASGNVDLDYYSQGPGSTIRFNGVVPQTLLIRAATATDYHDFDNLEVMGGAVVTVLDNPNSNFIVNGTLTLQPNATLVVTDTYDADGPLTFAAGGGNTLRLEGAVVADASLLGNPFSPGTGTVAYGGAAFNHTVYTRSNGVTINYHHLTVDTSGGRTATQEAAGLLRVNGNFTILGAASVFTSAAGSMNVAGSFICNGTFNHASVTVTMDGTGSITGTSASLLFNNLLVNGLTTSVVTAARSFSTAALFQVQQGTLTTGGLAAPIVMTALAGHSVGNGAGAAGTAQLSLLGPATLAVSPGFAFTVNAVDGRFSANLEAASVPTLTRAGGAGTFDAVVSGQIDVRRLNFSFGDLEGLEIAPSATVTNLRGIAFSGPNATPSARFLTIRSAGLSLDCPGCTFVALPAGTFNVWAQDTASGDANRVRIRLENRGVAPTAGGGGAGAGEPGDADDDGNDNGVIDGAETVSANHGGAIVQWVYTANVDVTGQIQGFPAPAFDWATFVYYSTYVLARDALGTGEDRIYVLDSEGDLKPYSFTLPAGSGDIVGPLFWNSEGAEHVVYFGTSAGRVYRLVDSGAGLAVPASGPWTTPFFDAANLDEVTSAIISDGVNLYFGGRDGGQNGVYRLSIATKTLVGGRLSTTNQRVGTAPAYADGATTRYLYCGTTVAGGTSHLYRIHVNNWVLDADFRNTSYAADAGDMSSDVVAYANVPVDVLYVGETNGRMHALPALGTALEFAAPVTGFPFRDASSAAIRGGAYREFSPGSRLIYGDAAGNLYTLNGTLPATPVLNTDYFRLSTGASAIQSMPLSQGGIVYAANASGQVFVVDANTGTAPPQAVLLTWNLGTSALGDVSRDFSTGRIYVGTAGGRLYSVPETSDPTVP